MTRPHVAVVGAGLAGLAASIGLADRGVRVTLFEGRPRAGGATWSFDRRGRVFDNGQHVYLACCTAYRGFLDRIGSSAHAPLRRLAIPVLAPRPPGAPRVATIARSNLPAPLHLASSLARYGHLSLADRARVARAVVALRALDLADPDLDTETFASFLRRHGQSRRAIGALWDLITLPTVNVHAEEASLALAAKVFTTGLLDRADSGDIGWADVPLGVLHAEPALALLDRLGVAVHLRAKVDGLDVDARGVTGVRTGGELVPVDGVVVAVNAEAAGDVLPLAAGVDTAALAGLGTSPIVDVHLVFDRHVMDVPVAAAIGSPVQFVFDRSRAAGLAHGDGQCLAVSVSGADREIGERPEVLIDRYVAAIGELFPDARDAHLVDAVVSREHHATFRGVPGTQALRPGATTAVPNLVLAGAYTDTGWPATMESAVRSANAAVTCLSDALNARTAMAVEREGI